MAEIGVVAGRAIGELRHMQRAEPERTRRLQPFDDRRGGRCNPAFAQLRAAARHLAGRIKHVLMRERHAVQRPLELALRERGIGSACHLQCVLGFDTNEGVDLRLPGRDAFQQRARDFDGG